MSNFSLAKSAMDHLVQVRKRFSVCSCMNGSLHNTFSFFYFMLLLSKHLGAATVKEVLLEKLVPVRGKHSFTLSNK